MRNDVFGAFRRAFIAAFAGSVLFAGGASAQQISRRSEPSRPFSASDFAKLKWLEGSWAGTAPGANPIYEQYRFVDDSTIDISYFRDSTFAHQSGTGRVYLTVGRVYYTYGPRRWGASHVDADGIFLVPQVNAQNTFGWKFKSPDSWTATMRSGVSGQERVTVYQMRRISPH